MKNRFLKDLFLDFVYILSLFFLFFLSKRDNPQKIDKSKPWLFVSCFKIGDSLFLTPAYREIKILFPSVPIWVLVNCPGARDVLKNNPNIDKVIFVDNYFAGLIFILKNINNVFGAVFDYSANYYWSLITKCLRHKFYLVRENQQKIGHFFFKKFEKFGYSRCYKNQYIVDYYLSLLDFLGVKTSDNSMNIFFSEDEVEKFNDKFSYLPKKYAIFHLSAGESENIWPHWLKLSSIFNEQFDLPILFTGDNKSNKLNLALANNLGGVKNNFFLVGNTSLCEVLWLVSRAELYVGGDTGITHVAISFDRKIVMIFGRADSQMYCPDRKNVFCLKPKTFCYPCYTYRNIYNKCPNYLAPGCTKSINVEDVLMGLHKIYG